MLLNSWCRRLLARRCLSIYKLGPGIYTETRRILISIAIAREHILRTALHKNALKYLMLFRCLGLQAFMTWRMLETQAFKSVVSRSLVLGSGLQRRNAITCTACHGITPLQGPLLGSESLAHSFSPAVPVGCFRHCCLFLSISQMTWVPVPEQLSDCPGNCLSRRFIRKDQRPLLDILLARMVCHAVRAGQ